MVIPSKTQKSLKIKDFCVRVQNCCSIIAPLVGLEPQRHARKLAHNLLCKLPLFLALLGEGELAESPTRGKWQKENRGDCLGSLFVFIVQKRNSDLFCINRRSATNNLFKNLSLSKEWRAYPEN